MGSQNHLTALPLELHTHIFSNLQPYDILQVRQTCQALYRASSQRTVWMDALHRICVENTLFEPSFPVANMSVLELQRASMGPHRWIARSSSKERNPDGVLRHSVTRHQMSAMSDLSIADLQSLTYHYVVPGGRYLFSFSHEWLVLWDLGSPYSSGREPHMIADVTVEYFDNHLVHSTSDGMGLRVFLYLTFPYTKNGMTLLHIYEIYPESTSPQLIQIAYTRLPVSDSRDYFSLSYDHLLFADQNILTVWDYKANTWARWAVEDEYTQIVLTKSTVMLIRTYGVSVWEIPPLMPESSLSMSTDPSVMTPVFELHYPENRHYPYPHQSLCNWYSATPQPLYFDVRENLDVAPQKIYRFKVIINPKISGGTLKLLKTFEVPLNEDYYFEMDARICQDNNVSICIDSHTGFLGIRTTDIYDQQLPSFLTPLYHPRCFRPPFPTFCPATCRVVYRETDGESSTSSFIVLDF